MSCRHDFANGTCSRCYPSTGTMIPGPEEDYPPNLDGPGAVLAEPAIEIPPVLPVNPAQERCAYCVHTAMSEPCTSPATPAEADMDRAMRVVADEIYALRSERDAARENAEEARAMLARIRVRVGGKGAADGTSVEEEVDAYVGQLEKALEKLLQSPLGGEDWGAARDALRLVPKQKCHDWAGTCILCCDDPGAELIKNLRQEIIKLRGF